MQARVLGGRCRIVLEPAFAFDVGFDPRVTVPLAHDVVIAFFLRADDVEAAQVTRGNALKSQQNGCRAREVLAPTCFLLEKEIREGIVAVDVSDVERVFVALPEVGYDAAGSGLVVDRVTSQLVRERLKTRVQILGDLQRRLEHRRRRWSFLCTLMVHFVQHAVNAHRSSRRR